MKALIPVIAIAVLGAGCATTTHLRDQPMPKTGWPVEIYLSQEEVGTEASATNPMAAGGGLLCVLIVHAIDKSKNTKAEDAATPLRDLLIDYPMVERFETMFADSGLATQLSPSGDVVVRQRARADFKVEPLKQSTLVIAPTVEFSNDLSNLRVALQISELVPDERGRAAPGSARGTYYYIHPLADMDDKAGREEHVQAWIALGRDRLVELIEEGLQVTIAMARSDLLDGPLAVTEQGLRVSDLDRPLPKLFLAGGQEAFVWARPKQSWYAVYAFPRIAVEYL